jgi:hypothetical protein
MDKEKHLKELETILSGLYPLLPKESDIEDVFTIKDLALEFNKEVERRLETPTLPGIEKNWNTIFLDTIEALKIDRVGYLKKVHSNIHPSHKDLREDLKKTIDEQ